jgi:hypothetical protein
MIITKSRRPFRGLILRPAFLEFYVALRGINLRLRMVGCSSLKDNGTSLTLTSSLLDNFMMQFGVRYVANYSQNAVGLLGIDEIENALPN